MHVVIQQHFSFKIEGPTIEALCIV